MISPRWLVQSSAIGVFGAALVAAPLWMALDGPQDSDDDSPVIQRIAVHQVDDGHITTTTIQQLEVQPGDADRVVRHVRSHQVRYHMVDNSPPLVCPYVPEERTERREVVDDANSIIEDGIERGVQDSDRRALGDADDDTPPWQ